MRIVFTLLIALLVLCGWLYATEQQTEELLVTFLDVGQGDATLIESPYGTQVLIDGGRGRSVLHELNRALGFFDRSIDVVVATHPDADHIGGLIEVLKRYEVSTILMTENESDTPEYGAFMERVREEGAVVRYVRRGERYDFGVGRAGSTTLTVLFPDHDPRALESNTSSIVAELEYGVTSFMLTGDSPAAIEAYLVSKDGESLKSDVLKAGHHGSRTSSSEVFVSAVSPTYVIISAGKDNSYGHPHREVMDRFTAHGIITKNTADEGSISVVSDGTSVRIK